MAAWILAAWVAGDFLAQQQSTLPAANLSIALGVLALLTAIAACFVGRRATDSATEVAGGGRNAPPRRPPDPAGPPPLAPSVSFAVTAPVGAGFVFLFFSGAHRP